MNEVASPIAVLDRTEVAQRWRALAVPALLLLASLSFAMFSTVASLFDLWWSSDGYGHGLIVGAVTVWLLYLRRDELAAIEPRISYLGLAVSVALMAVWFASNVLAVLIGEQVVFVLVILSVTWAVFGAQMAKLAALPVIYLYCAVPVWSYLVPLLQDSTALASTWMSRALGVPLYLEGVYMTIPDGVFLVAEVCAGISYLLAALSLGAFYALLNLRRAVPRLAIVAFSIVLGVVFNWVRVTGIVLIGHHSKMQSPMVNDHIMYGWVLFVLVVVAVMMMGRFLERFDDFSEAVVSSEHVPEQGLVARRRAVWTMAVVCSLVLLVPAVVAARWTAAPTQSVAVALPPAAGPDAGWVRAKAPPDGWAAEFQGADGEARSSYVSGERRVDLQLGYFSAQRQGAEAVNNRHSFFDWQGWRRVSQKAVADQVAIAPQLTVNEIIIRANDSSRLRMVWWWYRVDGEFTADTVQAKLLQMRALLSGRRAAGIFVMSSPVVGKIDKTRAVMTDWLRATAAPLQAGFVDEP